MDKSKIKLIIWDLDETLWKGVLSDGSIELFKNAERLVKKATDCGVVNAICSKNDFQNATKKIKELGLSEYFVFNSINWTPKGDRVKQIIEEMQLRAPNVLFLDDNLLNLEEAKKYCPDLMVGTPDIVDELVEYFNEKTSTDLAHKRLNQYKLLEKKKDFKATVGDNVQFLYKCNIQVEIKEDVKEQLDRIHELILRSNQLNFTKIRSTKEELSALVEDERVYCGYVSVKDNFGDYGIVGFFAIKNNECIHFVFSCRTLNMGVEQYVYNLLGRPTLKIVGEVASSPDEAMPGWINCQDKQKSLEKEEFEGKILIKGPCDLSQVFSFVKDSDNFIKEFVYVNDRGVSIEGAGHTAHILQSVTLDEDTKKRIGAELPFGDERMYDTKIFDEDISAIYFSLFTDPNLGLYREKKSGALVAFGEWTNDLTDESRWKEYINGEAFVANCKFTEESLTKIKRDYEFLGRMSPEQIVENLDFIYNRIRKSTKLILNIGSETAYEKNQNPAYKDRDVYNKKLNDLVRKWSENKSNVYIVDVNKYIKSQRDFTNNINHFVKAIYYEMFQEIKSILKVSEKPFSTKIKELTKRIKNKVKRLLRKK